MAEPQRGRQSASRPSNTGDDGALERALDKGRLDELPPNQPRGILGETNPSLKEVDDVTSDLNAGVSQEVDWPVIWLAIILSYLLFFPLAYLLVWRSRYLTRRSKIVLSLVGAVGIAYVAYRLAWG